MRPRHLRRAKCSQPLSSRTAQPTVEILLRRKKAADLLLAQGRRGSCSCGGLLLRLGAFLRGRWTRIANREVPDTETNDCDRRDDAEPLQEPLGNAEGERRGAGVTSRFLRDLRRLLGVRTLCLGDLSCLLFAGLLRLGNISVFLCCLRGDDRDQSGSGVSGVGGVRAAPVAVARYGARPPWHHRKVHSPDCGPKPESRANWNVIGCVLPGTSNGIQPTRRLPGAMVAEVAKLPPHSPPETMVASAC